MAEFHSKVSRYLCSSKLIYPKIQSNTYLPNIRCLWNFYWLKTDQIKSKGLPEQLSWISLTTAFWKTISKLLSNSIVKLKIILENSLLISKFKCLISSFHFVYLLDWIKILILCTQRHLKLNQLLLTKQVKIT